MDGIRFWKDTFFPSLTPLILTPKYFTKVKSKVPKSMNNSTEMISLKCKKSKQLHPILLALFLQLFHPSYNCIIIYTVVK